MAPSSSKSNIFVSDDEETERLDNYAPPSERRITSVKRTPRKRGIDVVSTGSPVSRKKPTPVKRIESKPKVVKNAPKIVFGLDFGTTYSGLAFTWSGCLDQITPLMDVDESNNDNPKVPSALDYTNMRAQNLPAWGDLAKDAPGSLQWFKLLLIDENHLHPEVRDSEHVQKARARLVDLDMTPEEAICDYLRGFWESCIDKIKNDIAQDTVVNSRFHIVVTLPAIWPDYARQRMREAVERAGILDKRSGVGDTVLTFVSEPEAAALATLKRIDGRCDIKEDDCFVVCDAGGGTVDIISYMVTKTEPMAVREVVKGAGALCGAVFVDDQFKLLVEEKLSEMREDALDILHPEELKRIMTDDWEKIRRKFTGDLSQAWTIHVPYSLVSPHHRGTQPMFTVTSADLGRVFEPVVERIDTLVRNQVNAIMEKEAKPPKYIILVGGFGRCKYLHAYLNNRFPGIEVLQSQNSEPWTAICRGAVIHGLTVEKMNPHFTVEVCSRKSRASYGIICQEKFDASKHLEEDKIWDEDQQDWKATNQMKWLVQEDEDIMVDRKFRHEFFKLLSNKRKEHTTTLWMTKRSPPPSRKDDSVTLHSNVKWNARIDWDRLPIFVNRHGKTLYQLDFAAEMKCSGGSTEFAIFHNGRRQASKNVSVEYHDRADV